MSERIVIISLIIDNFIALVTKTANERLISSTILLMDPVLYHHLNALN